LVVTACKKYIALFFILLSGLFILPKELIHEFTSHEDTLDATCYASDGLAVSEEHHHCDALQLFLPPCTTHDDTVQFSEFIKLISHAVFNSAAVSFEGVDSFSIRGPPVVS